MNENVESSVKIHKKQRRIKSQQDCNSSQYENSEKITVEVQLPENYPLRLMFPTGTKMSEVRTQLRRKLGKGITFFSFDLDFNIDYCLEEEIGEVNKSMRLRYEFLDENVNQQNNLHAYKIYTCISVGGFSKVFLVRSNKSGKFFAAKFIDKSMNESKKFRNLIENERQINTVLDHPFICKMYNFIETSHFFIFILDYCPAGELFGLMKNHREMTELQAKFYFLETILAINYMHERSIMYRDIKPQNILLDKKGHIKIADFGLAKVVRQKSNSYCGSLEYMAPEIVRGDDYDFGVDHYCLGSLLFEMMIGCPPFYNPDFVPEQTKHHIMNSEVKFPHHKKLTNQFKDFVSKLLNKNPKSRLGSIGGIRQILSHPWIGKFNRESLQKYRIVAPFTHDLTKNNFQTDYLPGSEILETIKKIKSDLKESSKIQKKEGIKGKLKSMTQPKNDCRTSVLKNRRLSNSKLQPKGNTSSKNLSSLLNFGLKVKNSKEKRRTKSSQDVSQILLSSQVKQLVKKAHEKYKTSSPLLQASPVNLSVYLQKTFHHSFSGSKKNRSNSRNSKLQQMSKKFAEKAPINKIYMKKDCKMVESGGLKKSGKQGKENLFKFKFEQKSRRNHNNAQFRALSFVRA